MAKNLPMKCLVALLLVGSASTVLAQAKISEDLRTELLEMGRRDQEVRERPQPPLNNPDIQALIEEMTKIDQANFRRLEEIINEFGWPGKHLVGEEASTAAWLILQHADLEQQKRYLPALRSAVAKGEARASNLAMTEDRILVGEHLEEGMDPDWAIELRDKSMQFLLTESRAIETVFVLSEELISEFLGMQPSPGYSQERGCEAGKSKPLWRRSSSCGAW